MGKKTGRLFITLVFVFSMGMFVVAEPVAANIETKEVTTVNPDGSVTRTIITAETAYSNAIPGQQTKQQRQMSTAAQNDLQPANIAITDWVGKEFLVLALPAESQSRGYDIYSVGDFGLQNRLPYTYAGRRVVIESVMPIEDEVSDFRVNMRDLKTGEGYFAHSIRGSVEGLALVEDLNKVRQVFVGKTIYARTTRLEMAHNTGFAADGSSLTVKFGQAMQVVDVWEGMVNGKPFYLVVETAGQRAALPFAYSWTNQPVNSWENTPAWSESFFVQNPATLPGWSQAVVDVIARGDVELGMTMQQVVYSWGNPQKTQENSNSQVVFTYGDKMLTFTNGSLTKMN